MTGITAMDLPDEALVSLILQIDDVADVLAFGATCARLTAIVRDDRLWMSLFARDHGYIYARGLFALGWTPGAGPGDPWSGRAMRFWREMMEAHEPTTDIDPHLGALGPDTPADARAPPPFAHMAAMGKNWRWLYACHTRDPVPAGGDADGSPLAETATRPGAVLVVGPADAMSVTLSTRTFRGDVSPRGLANGYGVEFRWRRGRAVGWTEGLWRDGRAHGWHVAVSRTLATSGFMRQACFFGVACSAARNGSRTWGKIGGQTLSGPCLREDADGTWLRGVVKGGVFDRATRWSSSGVRFGWSNDAAVAASGDDGGDWLERHPNGDTVLFRGVDTDQPTVVWFRCSPASPHREFAGRTIRDVRWTLVCVDAAPADNPQWIYVPQGDSDDARAFWRYVQLEGGIAWTDEARRIALDVMRQRALPTLCS